MYRFNVDTKCDTAAVCWYCQDLCERCLKPATHTFNTIYENNTYNFCSADCKDFCFVKQKEFNFKLDDSSGDIIQAEGHVFHNGELPTFVHIKISTAKINNLLVSYYERSLKSQLYFQLLCSKTFDILNPVLGGDMQLANNTDLTAKQISLLHDITEKLKT